MSPDRVVLTLLTLLVALGGAALMRRGWRGRQQRQGDLPPPPAPPVPRGRVLVGAVPGLVVGTTTAGDWLDRIAVHGLSDRSTADLVLTADGVHLEREGLPELYLPLAALHAAEPGDRLAGKVMGRGGLLLLTWQLGPRLVTTGFRATEHAQHRRLADAVTALLPVKETPA